MINAANFFDEAGLKTLIEEVNPDLRISNFKIIQRGSTLTYHLATLKEDKGYHLIGKRESSGVSVARPIEALCLLGYETFFPEENLTQSIHGNQREIQRVNQIIYGIVPKFEKLITQTEEFEKAMEQFVKIDLTKNIKSTALGLEPELSNYQIGVFNSFMREATEVLVQRGKDYDNSDFTKHSFPFRDLVKSYIKEEPPNARPLIMDSIRAIQGRLKNKAEIEHKNIFNSELILNSNGYRIYK